uniref:hypothetical protein n=1 Tax=Candidatus Electronema sp. TaxID=2698783 RepID=UPI00405694C3
MKLPKQAASVCRFGVSRAAEIAGVLPMSYLGDRWNVWKGALNDLTPCKIGCRTAQVASTAACTGSGPAYLLCLALATHQGEQCYMDCNGRSSGGSGGGGRGERYLLAEAMDSVI